MNSNNNVPEIRFEGFNDSWEQRKFEEMFTCLQNNTLSRADLNTESGVAQNIHYGDILVKYGEYLDASKEVLPYISDSKIVNKLSKSILQDGDIVIADTAEDDTVGKCTEIVGSKGKNIIAGLHTMPYRPKEKYASKFLGYYLNSSAYHNQLIPLMQGIKVTSISKSALCDTELIVPTSIEEQERIGTYFSNLDNLITLHQSKYEKLLDLKESMLYKLFPKEGEATPEIRFNGFTEDWEKTSITELLEERNTQLPKDEEYPLKAFIAYEGIADKGDRYDRSSLVKDEDNKKYKRTELGDFIYSSNNLTTGSIGLNKFGKSSISPVYSIFSAKKKVDYNFIGVVLTRKKFINKMIKTRQGVVYGQWRIHEKDFLDLFILAPNYIEQKVIGEYFSRLDNLINLNKEKLEKLKNVKSSLFDNMFA